MSKFILLFMFIPVICLSQSEEQSFNVFTGGLFMQGGKVEAKLYNNLYTQKENGFAGQRIRSSFNTTFLQLTFGSNKNINYGFDFLYKSNIIADAEEKSPLNVFSFMKGSQRNMHQLGDFDTYFQHGLSHLGPRVRTKPFKNKRITLQQAIYVPTGALPESWIINTDIFYEYIYRNKYMIFADLGIWYPLHADPFPYFRVFAGTLLFERFGPFLMLNLPYEAGVGTKIFLNRKIELELMYTKWLPFQFIVQDRIPYTLNFGLRVTNFNNW